jgi:uncharacterized lipoprotein YddW (UPF0748 family)
LLAAIPLLVPPPAQAQAQGEVRALWVDAFHDGIKTPAQVERLVADARRANVNTLLVQVRRRGDLLYRGGPEPLADDIAPKFDPLQAVLDAAHNGSPRLEVQAWLAVYPLWHRQSQPPAAPGHLLHRHGNGATGEDNWLLQRDDGETWTGEAYWLDPGHPAVNPYLVDLMADLVKRYEIDGLHLDRLRYPEGDSLGGSYDRRWGYNPASVIRFDLEQGRSGQPEPGDPRWAQFRRERVTELLRQARETTLALRPGLKLSAAVIPWAAGPRRDADWLTTAAYRDVFQDWRAWLEEGLLDQAYVMNYNRESSAQQVGWQEGWFTWQRSKGYGRQVVAGLAPYLNTPEETVQQVRRALGPGPDGARLAGVALYSYAVPDPTRLNADPADDSPPGYLWDLLARPTEANAHKPPFAEPVAAPGMSWRTDAPEQRGLRKSR